MFELSLVFIFGLAAGFLGGYAGIGGAPLLIALTVLILPHMFTQHTAQGTILAVMLGPMTLPAMVAMRDRIKPLMKVIIAGVLAYAIASWVGAALAFEMPERAMRWAFMGLLVFLGLNDLLFLAKPRPENELPNPDGLTVHPSLIPTNPLTLGIACLGIGVVGGFFGIGAGVLMVPLFTRLFGVHKDDARTLSLAILLPPVSVAAVWKYHTEDAVQWPAAGVMFIAYLITNFFGARLGRSHSHAMFQRIFGVIMLLLAASYLVPLVLK